MLIYWPFSAMVILFSRNMKNKKIIDLYYIISLLEN